ncbi:hypothetical protein NQZ68_005157 [Dissostichus eleginoides]|nr:hypothetical protein NQZ68_005157 [Dissostichus eleginoides]
MHSFHGAEQGLELYQVLHLLADMASHRDTAEGGANEEFNDIIKWRSAPEAGRFWARNSSVPMQFVIYNAHVQTTMLYKDPGFPSNPKGNLLFGPYVNFSEITTPLSGKSPLLSDSFSHCQVQPHPTKVTPLSCDQHTSCCCKSPGKERTSIPLIYSSLAGQGATEAEEERQAGMSNSVLR